MSWFSCYCRHDEEELRHVLSSSGPHEVQLTRSGAATRPCQSRLRSRGIPTGVALLRLDQHKRDSSQHHHTGASHLHPPESLSSQRLSFSIVKMGQLEIVYTELGGQVFGTSWALFTPQDLDWRRVFFSLNFKRI